MNFDLSQLDKISQGPATSKGSRSLKFFTKSRAKPGAAAPTDDGAAQRAAPSSAAAVEPAPTQPAPTQPPQPVTTATNAVATAPELAAEAPDARQTQNQRPQPAPETAPAPQQAALPQKPAAVQAPRGARKRSVPEPASPAAASAPEPLSVKRTRRRTARGAAAPDIDSCVSMAAAALEAMATAAGPVVAAAFGETEGNAPAQASTAAPPSVPQPAPVQHVAQPVAERKKQTVAAPKKRVRKPAAKDANAAAQAPSPASEEAPAGDTALALRADATVAVTRQRGGRSRRQVAPALDSDHTESQAGSEGSDKEEGAEEEAAGGRRRRRAGKAERKERVALADQELDPVNMSLREIVRWGGAVERRTAAQERLRAAQANAEDQAAGVERPAAGAIIPAVAPSASVLAPQVQVIDGRIVVNRQSLTVQAQERQQYTRVVTEDSARLTALSYTNRISNERWTLEDTELFFKALSQFGTDFTLITHLFPGRQRRHLKNKFTRESKLNAQRVDEALAASQNATITSYQEMIAMLKESGMNVGGEQPAAPSPPRLAITDGQEAGGSPGEAAGDAGPSQPAAAPAEGAPARRPAGGQKQQKRRAGKAPAEDDGSELIDPSPSAD